MVRSNYAFLFCMLMVALLVTTSLAQTNNQTDLLNRIPHNENIMSQVDHTPPSIWAWGISGNANQSVPFIAWANVTDDGVGVRNVTVRVSAPNYTLVEELTYNGTFYEGQLEPLLFPGEYDLQIRAYDMNNNTQTGRYIIVTITSTTDVTLDESLTMPAVVASSILLAIIVTMVAVFYDKRGAISN